MSNRETPYQYNEIISWLEAYCKKGQKRVKTYRGLEYSPEFVRDVEAAKEVGTAFFIDPRLPIDLVVVKSTKRKEEITHTPRAVSIYTLFWFVTSYDRSIETKVKFYQLYLSRLSRLDAVQVIIVIPFTSGQRLRSSLRKIAKENGIGLWRVKPGEKPEEICAPKDFRKYMEDTFRNPPEKPKRMKRFSLSIREQAPDITFFYERFVREAVEAMAGVTPQTVGKRYIEREILDLVFQLQHSLYLQKLQEMVAKHLAQKDNDFDFVSKIFSDLWMSEFGMRYSDFLEVSEAPLYNIFAGRVKPYRDHYLHQFQVFLLGLYIIDNLRSRFESDIDKQWLITASFHDMAYPIQLYDAWAKKFFNKSLGISEMGALDIRSFFVDKSLLVRLGFIMNALCKRHFRDDMDDLRGNWLYEERDIVMFFHEKITKVKHHCILSSLYLLKEAQSLSQELLESLFVPSALAIAIHHPSVMFNKDDKAFQNLRVVRQLKSLKFDRDPLSFLLMFCDCVQEWGRPTSEKPSPRNVEEVQEFVFQKCYIDTTECSVTIKTPYLYEIDQRFVDKADEIRTLGKFLESPPGLEFKIILEDRSEKQTPFIMQGPS